MATSSIAYLDCASGISGDMTLGALVDLGIDLAAIQAGIDSLGLPSCRLEQTEVRKRGFRATQIRVIHEPEHAHRHLHHIVEMIDASDLTPSQQSLAKQIFAKIGEAEAHVHGTTIEKVHFHEVGAVDSIADIVGAAIGWDLLGVDRIVCSAIPTGSGTIEIAHGRCSIPAPATAELLKGIPIADNQVEAELTTPTGAAIVATLASAFGPLPPMEIDRIGYGAGERDLETQPNLLRLLVGTTAEHPAVEPIWVVETNLDDASGELIGHAVDKLWQVGALDVYTTPIQMKKQRPGCVLTVLCRGADHEAVEQILFRETTTLGIRRWRADRSELARECCEVSTPWGSVTGVVATLPDGNRRFSPEYEACKLKAAEHSISLRQVYQAAEQAFLAGESR